MGQTIDFIGSSGVGKSTLINRIMGENILETNGIRNDDKGRHTTTRREILVIPSGGIKNAKKMLKKKNKTVWRNNLNH